MKKFPLIPEQVDLDPVDSPLIVSTEDLAEIVEAFYEQQRKWSAPEDSVPVVRIDYDRKNALNNMTKDYAKEIRKRYLKETKIIQDFLSAPENDCYRKMYESVVGDYQLKIISKRKDYQTFDEVIEYLVTLLFGRDPVLNKRENQRLTRAFLFFMYWNCDIGQSGDENVET